MGTLANLIKENTIYETEITYLSVPAYRATGPSRGSRVIVYTPRRMEENEKWH